jgi:hypothetical protein
MADDFLYLEVIGDRNVIRNLETMPDTVRVILAAKAEAWVDKLKDKVIDNIHDRFVGGTGKLAGAVESVVVNNGYEVEGRVFIAGIPYAKIQEEGGVTQPHLILPVNAKVLAFMAATGDKVMATKVMHPGSRITGKHYMKDAYREMGPEISRGIKKAVVDGIRQKMRQS